MIGSMSGVHGRAPIHGSVSRRSASGKRSRAIGSARPSCTGVLIASRRANSAPVVSRIPDAWARGNSRARFEHRMVEPRFAGGPVMHVIAALHRERQVVAEAPA